MQDGEGEEEGREYSRFVLDCLAPEGEETNSAGEDMNIPSLLNILHCALLKNTVVIYGTLSNTVFPNLAHLEVNN